MISRSYIIFILIPGVNMLMFLNYEETVSQIGHMLSVGYLGITDTGSCRTVRSSKIGKPGWARSSKTVFVTFPAVTSAKTSLSGRLRSVCKGSIQRYCPRESWTIWELSLQRYPIVIFLVIQMRKMKLREVKQLTHAKKAS